MTVRIVAEIDDHRVRTSLEPAIEGVPANTVFTRRLDRGLLDYTRMCPATGPADRAAEHLSFHWTGSRSRGSSPRPTGGSSKSSPGWPSDALEKTISHFDTP